MRVKREEKRKEKHNQQNLHVRLRNLFGKEVCRLFYNRVCCRIKLSLGRVCSVYYIEDSDSTLFEWKTQLKTMLQLNTLET